MRRAPTRPSSTAHDTGLASVRTQVFTRTFPRCGIHQPFGDWSTYADFVALLERTNSIVESTQLWWSVRPHHAFGTVEVRICDAQSNGADSLRLGALMLACVAQSALDYDDGVLPAPQPGREIEENLWRAIRFGLDGKLIDFAAGEEIEAARAVEQLLEWTAPAREGLGLDAEPAGRQRSPARPGRAPVRRGRSPRSTATRSPRRAAPTRRSRLVRVVGMEGAPPPQGPPGGPGPAGPGAPGGEEPELTEEQIEYLRQMEEEMRRVRVQDVVTQSAVSILNLAARRIAKEDERDLEQGRVGIEAVRALVDLLDDPRRSAKSATPSHSFS